MRKGHKGMQERRWNEEMQDNSMRGRKMEQRSGTKAMGGKVVEMVVWGSGVRWGGCKLQQRAVGYGGCCRAKVRGEYGKCSRDGGM